MHLETSLHYNRSKNLRLSGRSNLPQAADGGGRGATSEGGSKRHASRRVKTQRNTKLVCLIPSDVKPRIGSREIYRTSMVFGQNFPEPPTAKNDEGPAKRFFCNSTRWLTVLLSRCIYGCRSKGPRQHCV